MLWLLNIFLLEKIDSVHFITQQKLEELKKQLEEKKAVVENLKGTDIFEQVHLSLYVQQRWFVNIFFCVMAVKKEEVEAVEKEAKDKHEKDWEGKGHYNVQLMR